MVSWGSFPGCPAFRLQVDGGAAEVEEGGRLVFGLAADRDAGEGSVLQLGGVVAAGRVERDVVRAPDELVRVEESLKMFILNLVSLSGRWSRSRASARGCWEAMSTFQSPMTIGRDPKGRVAKSFWAAWSVSLYMSPWPPWMPMNATLTSFSVREVPARRWRRPHRSCQVTSRTSGRRRRRIIKAMEQEPSPGQWRSR